MVSVKVGDENVVDFHEGMISPHELLLHSLRGVKQERVSTIHEGHAREVSFRRGGGTARSEEGEGDAHTYGRAKSPFK